MKRESAGPPTPTSCGKLDRLLAPARTPDAGRADRIACALSVVGQFDSGRTDISVEHDRELDDSYGS